MGSNTVRGGVIALAVVVMATLLSGCLAAEGAKSGRMIGTWIDPWYGMPNAKYQERLGEFGMLEVYSDWQMLEPCNECWNWSSTDTGYAEVARRKAVPKGSTIVWAHNSKKHPENVHIPAYLSSMTTAQLRNELRDHVQAVVRRYPHIKLWTVVNEAFEGDGSLRNNPFKKQLGNTWIREALIFAYQANPSAKFIAINDFGADGTNTKSTAMLNYYKNHLIGAIPAANLVAGFQMHLDSCMSAFNFSGAEVKANLQRFANKGIEVHITEMDFQIRCIDGNMAKKLEQQKKKYHDVAEACMKVSLCKAISFWGVGDPDSWIRYYQDKSDWPLLFDDNYNSKPAYDGFVDALNGR